MSAFSQSVFNSMNMLTKLNQENGILFVVLAGNHNRLGILIQIPNMVKGLFSIKGLILQISPGHASTKQWKNSSRKKIKFMNMFFK